MLGDLLESAPRRRNVRAWPGATLSLAVHAVLVYGAVVATRDNGLADVATSPVRVDLTYHEPARTPKTPALTLPEDQGIVIAPVEVPTVVLPPDTSRAWDPRVFDRFRSDPPAVRQAPAPRPIAGAAYIEEAVDERPDVILAFSPAYPDLLRQAGIEGTVVIEAIIDTAGRAEAGSVRVVRSTNRAFDAPARDAVLRTRYRPGRIGGTPVRVLVQVPISFTLRRQPGGGY